MAALVSRADVDASRRSRVSSKYICAFRRSGLTRRVTDEVESISNSIVSFATAPTAHSDIARPPTAAEGTTRSWAQTNKAFDGVQLNDHLVACRCRDAIRGLNRSKGLRQARNVDTRLLCTAFRRSPSLGTITRTFVLLLGELRTGISKYLITSARRAGFGPQSAWQNRVPLRITIADGVMTPIG
jgi:hypothetical protein